LYTWQLFKKLACQKDELVIPLFERHDMAPCFAKNLPLLLALRQGAL